MSLLYRRILGDDVWRRLPAPVRAAHGGGGRTTFRGVFCVTRGSNVLARLLAPLLRAPPACERVDVTLVVETTPDGERWLRRFGDHRLTTTQRDGGDGVLYERFGPLELAFRLTTDERGIGYRQQRARLRLGPMALPLPRFLSPRVTAREEVVDEERTHVRVELSLPLVGRIVTYDGTLNTVVIAGAPR